jgi:hypothetical protein
MEIQQLRNTDLSDQLFVWCWTGNCFEYECGTKSIKTVRVTSIYELAKRVWLEGWIPFGEVTWIRKKQRSTFKGDFSEIKKELVPAMEHILRLKYEGKRVPDEAFIEIGEIPEDYLMPNDDKIKDLTLSQEKEVLDVIDGTVVGTKKIKVDPEWIKQKMEDERKAHG